MDGGVGVGGHAFVPKPNAAVGVSAGMVPNGRIAAAGQGQPGSNPAADQGIILAPWI